jgi:hypothetical protein
MVVEPTHNEIEDKYIQRRPRGLGYPSSSQF